jgi:hypothetical protein
MVANCLYLAALLDLSNTTEMPDNPAQSGRINDDVLELKII